MAADGHLNFDTAIDESGFERGRDKLSEAAKELTGELRRLTDVIRQAADIRVTADTSQAQQAVDELSAEMHEAAAETVTISVDAAPAESAAEQIADDIGNIGDAAEDTADEVSEGIRASAEHSESTVDSAAGRIEESLGKVQSGFRKLLAAAGLVFGIKEAVSFGKAAVENAASVNAANSQLAQTFGELEDSAADAMKRVADASGIVKTRLQGAGTSVYAFARTSGMGSAEALGMMEEALQVAADSAAYYDRSLEDTSETLMSFLKGNYANDAALGLSATETTRNAAANKLYGKSFQELSEAQKQLTLLQMVKDANALSGAEGQAAREAEGWENVLGNLREAWRQLLAVVGQPVLKLAITWVQQLTEALTYLTEKAQIAISTLAALFGKEAEDTGQAAENITQSVSAQEDLTDAVEDTAKAESKSLAGFDKINTLASDKNAEKGSSKGSSAPAAAPKITVSDNTSKVSKRLESFVKKTQKLFGSLEKFLSRNFAPSFRKVWEQLSPQVGRFKDNMAKVLGDIQSLGAPLLSYFSGQFIPFLQTLIETSGSILAGLFDSFNTVFSDIWSIAVFPVLESFISTGLPLITEFTEQSVISFGTLFSEVKKCFDLLWNDAAEPILSLVAKIWKDTMGVLQKFWDDYGKVIFEKFRTAIQTTGEVIRTVWKAVFKPVFDTLMKVLDEIWTDHAKPLIENFLDFAGTLAAVALDVYNNFIAPMVKWFAETFGPVISGVFSAALEYVGGAIGGVMDALSELWAAMKDLLDLIVNVFKGDWSAAWNSLKKVFEHIWNALVDIVKAPLNAMIGFINVLLDAVKKAVNFLIDCLNTISIDVPNWVPKIGGKTFGFDIDHIKINPIPPLAQGTVVPANYGNFLAMLGDNKREPEIVSPLSTMEEAVENVLARSGRKDQTIHVHVELDGREIGRVAVKAVEDDNRRKGA